MIRHVLRNVRCGCAAAFLMMTACLPGVLIADSPYRTTTQPPPARGNFYAAEPRGASMATTLRRFQDDDATQEDDQAEQRGGQATQGDASAANTGSRDADTPQPDPAATEDDADADADEKKKEKEKNGDDKAKKEAKEDDKPKSKPWYEKLQVRGYTQLRINETVSLEDGSAPPQNVGDASVADDQNFFIRRARVILQGDVHDHAFIYLQPDFASNVPGSPDAIHFTQIRDWYADLYIDKTKEFRIRAGQSKVPFGFENMQSSSNRLPLDRADPLNSAVKNERDLGVFFYWTPTHAQEFFQSVLDDGLKGSGNYGMLGLGFYNGQGGSLREQNDDLHFVARYQVPITLDNCQRMELGIQGYTGHYTVLSSPISPLGMGPTVRPLGTLETGNEPGILDERLAATFVYYPEPWGFQAEWNVGRGPALNDAQTAVIARDLHGGYAMTMYRIQTENYGDWFPFYRYQHYRGGFKAERNAPFGRVDEHEIGLEWQMNRAMELTTMYTFTDRTNAQAMGVPGAQSYDQFVGQLMRFQFQFNY